MCQEHPVFDFLSGLNDQSRFGDAAYNPQRSQTEVNSYLVDWGLVREVGYRFSVMEENLVTEL